VIIVVRAGLLLGNNEVIIWHGSLAENDTNYQKYWQIIDENEKRQAGQIKKNLLHKRYVEAHGLLRSLLGETVGHLPEKLRIKKTKFGKPYLEDFPDFEFNIAHSNNRLLISVGSKCRLGIDIEICKPRNNLPGLVKKCFAKEEQFFWGGLPDTEQHIEFYRFWTRKEAFVKATGQGIALGLHNCVINPEKPEEFLRIPKHCGSISEWHLHDINLGLDVCSALVTNKQNAKIRLINIDVS
jgi:4'-phosphopantetheinyl transferase